MGTVDVKDDEKLLDMTLKMIGKVAELPVVRVNREQFLRKQFASSPHIETILSEGPQSVYTLAGLEKKARKVVATSTAQTSAKVGANLGKKVAAQALTKTAWYPLVKKIGAVIGQKITKKTVEKTISKAVPVVGGIVSGGLTYITFRPMGNRLAETLMTNLEGGFDPDLDLNPEFAARSRSGGTVILEGEVG